MECIDCLSRGLTRGPIKYNTITDDATTAIMCVQHTPKPKREENLVYFANADHVEKLCCWLYCPKEDIDGTSNLPSYSPFNITFDSIVNEEKNTHRYRWYDVNFCHPINGITITWLITTRCTIGFVVDDVILSKVWNIYLNIKPVTIVIDWITVIIIVTF